MAINNLKQTKLIEQASAIIYSASMDARNHLRGQVSKYGISALCFENEAVCFDNFESIQPKIVIAETDTAEVIWRFIFALHESKSAAPLVVLSDRLTTGRFVYDGLKVSVYAFPKGCQDECLFMNVSPNTETTVNHIPLFVGQSSIVNQIKVLLPSIAKSRDSVMITGEKGTGKELLARHIVDLEGGQKWFIKVDCEGLLPDMLVKDLYRKSLGNGIQGKSVTIFLDRLNQLSESSQAEMLLIVEASQKSHNGSSSKGNNTVRFIAASDKSIERLVSEGKFRKDLFYRLNVIPIYLPPLRERREDISLLMDYFVIQACIKSRKCIKIPSQQARAICYNHNWPGNVSELKTQMGRVAETGAEWCLNANSSIPNLKKDKGVYLSNKAVMDELPSLYEIKDYLPSIKDMSLKGICDEFVYRTERRIMKKALESTNWNRKKAAKLLNISYKSMLNKMKVYDIF